MERGKRYIRRSADGRFFLYIEKSFDPIDQDKKTKLWTASEYLFKCRVSENPVEAFQEITDLIEWNEKEERYEDCATLINMRRKFFRIGPAN